MTALAEPRVWRRFSLSERILRSVFYLFALIVVVWSIQTSRSSPSFSTTRRQQTVDLFARMWPIDWSWYPKVVHEALMETLHIATLGTILAVLLASLVALLAARNITPSATLNLVGRFILVATRSVHAMVWALFFVAVFGPGALAGTLAIAVHSIGFTGKFLSEAIEEAKTGPIEALTAAGASPLRDPAQGLLAAGEARVLVDRRCFAGTSTCASPRCSASSAAAGSAWRSRRALDNLYWDRAGLVLLVIFGIVIVTEIVTTTLRRRII